MPAKIESAIKPYKAEWLQVEFDSLSISESPLISGLSNKIFSKLAPAQQKAFSESEFKKLQIAFIDEFSQRLKSLTAEPRGSFNSDVNHDAWLKNQRDLVKSAFERTRLRASLTKIEKIEILRGMVTTRYLDARLKKFFTGNEIMTPEGKVFQGKGFRSMGQEAIYAAAIRLNRVGPHDSSHSIGPVKKGDYHGDFAAVMIRDLGLALAMGINPYDVMAAQMGKIGKPTNGKDLHIGDLHCGVLPPSAPIALSVGNAAGMGLALKGTGRVVINCNGEGATSAGEWHEAINFAAVQKLPVVFIVQNNQTALSTPTNEQYACGSLTQKAAGYGMRSCTIDGTDPEAVFAAVTEATETCRNGQGPILIEMRCMRMCGHAHHDDMLYFGKEPTQFLQYPELHDGGYIDAEKYEFWRQKDPVATYSKKLMQENILTQSDYAKLLHEVEEEIEQQAQKVIAAQWPAPEVTQTPVFTNGQAQRHTECLENRATPFPPIETWQSTEPVGFTSSPKGKTFWQAIVEALDEELARDTSTFILGEDVGGKYGNAFVILKSLLAKYSERMLNTPLSESAIIGAATGAALLGKRPIAEIQFNDFVASGFNQLVNNTAKIYYRWQQPVPVTIRLPWGGLRHAGPFHSQNTEPWFYRTPGLKIVCPSTPREAKGLLKAAIRDDNPVLFYEHIALYRDSGIKEDLPNSKEDFVLPIGQAHLKREGRDLTIITYGAYVHKCLAAATQLQKEREISCKILDLRSLQPLDKTAILSTVKSTGKVLIVQEDSKTGGIGQSISAIIAEEAFEYLDAPIRILGALDTPVPYSPPLENRFLINVEQIKKAAILLTEY